MSNRPLFLTREHASALGVICSTIAAHLHQSAPTDDRKFQQSLGVLAQSIEDDRHHEDRENLLPSSNWTWRGWVVPLLHNGQLLLFDGGSQQLELQVDIGQQLIWGAWTDLCHHVLFSCQHGDLQIENLTHPELNAPVGAAFPVVVREPAQSVELLALAGPLQGRSFPLLSRTRIGRNLDNEIVICDSSVSRYHAVVESNGSGCRVIDNGSLHGVFVNGVRVQNALPLRIGDRIRILDSEFIFQPIQLSSRITDPDRRLTIKIRPGGMSESEPCSAANS